MATLSLGIVGLTLRIETSALATRVCPAMVALHLAVVKNSGVAACTLGQYTFDDPGVPQRSVSCL